MTSSNLNGSENLKRLLLDSSLITPVRFLEYDYKIVRCGDYLQVYYYEKIRCKDNIKDLDINSLKKCNNIITSSKEIRDDNIIRTKLNCQRIAKANCDKWNTFITLTYKENMTDIKQAKKDLEYFVTNIKKVKKDFCYMCVPELQKRGAIHYHLLTNLSLQDNYIIVKQKNNTKYYNVKYWNKGFVKVDFVSGDMKKIIGYISKYMSKECDKRFFGIKRYTYSQNLEKPVEEVLNVSNERDLDYLINLLSDKECIYNNSYQDLFNNTINFSEFKIKD